MIDIWRKQHLQQNACAYHCERGNEHIFSKLDYNILEVLHRRLERLYTRFEQNPNDEDKIDIELIKENINEILQISVEWKHYQIKTKLA